MQRTSPVLLLFGLSSCLISEEVHQQRLDQDGDGLQREEDCDDQDASVGPPQSWYVDADGDGYGSDELVEACEQPDNSSQQSGDCDDQDASAGLPQSWYVDADGDGYASDEPVEACEQPDNSEKQTGDCDDDDASVHPGAEETYYDGVDQDCQDDDDYDADGDGFSGGKGGDDCDDEDAEIHPGAFENIDGVDNDCDGHLDYVALTNALAYLKGGYDDLELGSVVAAAGDVDADGYDDLLIGTDESAGDGTYGRAYLVGGQVQGEHEIDDVATAIFIGAGAADKAGYAVAGAGDMDADGYDDVIIGARRYGPDKGEHAGGAFLVKGPVSGNFSLADADAVILGEAEDDEAGYYLAGSADFDGDAYEDFIVGAVEYPQGAENGAAYLVLGPVSGWISLTESSAGVTGEDAGDRLGKGLAAIDTNGDGLDELVVGAREEDEGGSNAGAAYVIDMQGELYRESLGSDGTKMTGEESGDYAGCSVAGLGDMNGDGFGDIAVGAESCDKLEDNGGAVYVLTGPVVGGALDIAPARLYGTMEGERAGRSVAGPGDIDGDGTPDLLIGAPVAKLDQADAGAAYLVLGPLSGHYELEDAQQQFSGDEPGEKAGWSVAGVGDANGDGVPDLLVGAYAWGEEAGAAYLVAGQHF